MIIFIVKFFPAFNQNRLHLCSELKHLVIAFLVVLRQSEVQCEQFILLKQQFISGLWILIYFLRIRIQLFSMRIRIQPNKICDKLLSEVLKKTKNIAQKL